VKSHPELWQNGAYSSRAVYSIAQVAKVKDYAKMRGVRVMVEIDTPGHAFSWGLGMPQVILNCSKVTVFCAFHLYQLG